MEHKAVEVILLGGRLFKHSVVSAGTAGDYEEAAVKRALSHAAAETYVLASAEKWNAASPYLVLGLTEVAAVISEQDIDAAITRPYFELGLSILRA